MITSRPSQRLLQAAMSIFSRPYLVVATALVCWNVWMLIRLLHFNHIPDTLSRCLAGICVFLSITILLLLLSRPFSFPRDSVFSRKFTVTRQRLQSIHVENSFPLTSLPLELVLEILKLSSSTSQSNYRSLVLTSRNMRDLVRIDCLQNVPVIIDSTTQILPFTNFIMSHPKVMTSIRYLWIIPVDNSPNAPSLHKFSSIIIQLCPNIISLACHPDSLLGSLSFASARRPLSLCSELTLAIDKPCPQQEPGNPQIASFCQLVERLHLIGPYAESGWQNMSQLRFPNLKYASVSVSINLYFPYPPAFSHVIPDSHNLERLKVITDLSGEAVGKLEASVIQQEAIGKADISFEHRPPGEEMTAWIDGLRASPPGLDIDQ
ncbi:hypothetical protein C8J56DRAFT_19650 [Mycena floridula]|nr:hypothetical protein C8J56DRAFT_19650 [Mycena floridula]